MRIDSPLPTLPQTLSIEPNSIGESLIFRIGERLEGQLMEWIDEHHALFQFEGRSLSVESRFTLQPGMKGSFEVEALSPQFVLRLLPENEGGLTTARIPLPSFLPDAPVTEAMEKLLTKQWEGPTNPLPPSIQTTVNHLRSLLERSSFLSPADPQLSQKVVLASGLFFEERLKHLIETRETGQAEQIVAGDLKGLLTKLKAQLESLGESETLPKNAAFLKEVEAPIEKILQKIEGYQFLNTPSADAPDKYYLLLPLWLNHSFQFVEMSLSLPQRDSDKRETGGMSLLFLLDLTELGKMSIEVKIREQRLYCRFHISDPGVSPFLEAALPELQDRLAQLGFQPELSLSVESEEKIHQDWIAEIGGDSASLFSRIV